jgi:NAD(P)-dependent dehydrogenase (short-subunit alcohol dehydrogenase family)
MRWALVTGTSTGIGRAISLKLVAEGINVFAGVRRPGDADSLSAEASRATSPAAGKLCPLILDVTREQEIASAIDRVSDQVGSNGLWALVNNAGIVVPGPVEYLSLADWRKQFDVNFFGMCELTRVALPLLRQSVTKLGSGVPRIMFVSSIGGRVAQPLLSPYTSSKFATTALGDSLRLELHRQGIGVTVLEPGAIATAIWDKGESAGSEFTPDHPAMALYRPELEGLLRLSRKTAKNAIPAEQAAGIAIRALFRGKAPARVLVGRDAKVMAFLRKWLPLSWFDAILLREFGISTAPAKA